MLGMFNLLPLLKGWEYKLHKLEGWVEKGKSIEMAVSETGWLMTIPILTTDCYLRVQIQWQGADLETQEFILNAEAYADWGAFMQDPGGWVQRYSRPNPFSSAGIFFFSPFSGGYQGSAWPYVPTVKITAYLPVESTQERAYVIVMASVIAITDAKLFIQSLRRVLDARASLKVDRELLVPGPEELREE